MKITHIYDKGSAVMNEDDFLIKDNLFVVFDGATCVAGKKEINGKSVAKLAAEIVKEEFSHNDASLLDLAEHANNTLRDAMEKEGINLSKKEELWSTTVAAVRMGDADLEYLNISDSLVLAIMEDGSYKLMTSHHDHDMEMMIQWKKLATQKIKNIRAELAEKMILLRKRANVDYGVLNGEKKALDFCQHGRFSLKGVKTLLLFTDGIFLPKEDPQALPDWEKFALLYQKGGLQGLLMYVRDLQKTDQYSWKYPRYKQHDDVAAIAIDF
jgi:serine/threonine protein phosphatase PrpC